MDQIKNRNRDYSHFANPSPWKLFFRELRDKRNLRTNILGVTVILFGVACCVFVVFMIFSRLLCIDFDEFVMNIFGHEPMFLFGFFGFMAIIRGRDLILMKTKANIILCCEIAGIALFLLVFIGLMASVSFILPNNNAVFGSLVLFSMVAYVFICRYIVRKENFTLEKGKILGRGAATILTIIFFLFLINFVCDLILIMNVDAYPGLLMLGLLQSILVAYAFYRGCLFLFKRI